MYCVPATKLINTKKSHKDISQVVYINSIYILFVQYLVIDFMKHILSFLRFSKHLLENLNCLLVMTIWTVVFGEESLCEAI